VNLIEQLGGYERAKHEFEMIKEMKPIYPGEIETNNRLLLEYRRQHNIFEVGDKVYGVGVNDRSRPAYFNNKATKEYDHWVGMLERCYGQNKHIKSRPTYGSCECSENFKSYSYFYDWCQSQSWV